jgi:hypothetical protein
LAQGRYPAHGGFLDLAATGNKVPHARAGLGPKPALPCAAGVAQRPSGYVAGVPEPLTEWGGWGVTVRLPGHVRGPGTGARCARGDCQ